MNKTVKMHKRQKVQKAQKVRKVRKAKAAVYQIHRHGLIWLLVAFCATVLPHIAHLPIWLSVVVITCVACRIMVYFGRWGFPTPFFKGLMVAAGGMAIYVDYDAVMGTDAGVALLVLTYALKLIEMHREKDAYLIVLLSYFVIATLGLYSTSLLSSLYILLVVVLITSALIALNQSQRTARADAVKGSATGRVGRLALLLMLQSVPLMVVLFLFFPRLPPFLTLKIEGDQGISGLSDAMSPSDVANMGRSNRLAFRADFEGDPPASDQLYWRAIMLDHFDGRTWFADKKSARTLGNTYWPMAGMPAWFSDTVYEGEQIQYTVMLEPTGKRYLPALDIPYKQNNKGIQGQGIGISRDFTLRRRDPVNALFRYDAVSRLSYQLETQLPNYRRKKNTALPSTGNDASRQFAQALFQRVDQNIGEYILEVNRFFSREPFVYTLNPPTAATDIVDHFLFQSRQGFCMHYASAYTYLMRAVGVPARVVVGFQGGEVNPLGQYVLVHEFDAHGWVEVWLEGRGWVRFDPTGYVSPERIQNGIQDTVAQSRHQEQASFFSAINMRQIPLINTLRLSFDYVNFSWNQYVVGYDEQQQLDFLKRYFKGISAAHVMVAVLVLMVIIFSLVVFFLVKFRSVEKIDPVDRAYLGFCHRLSKRGVSRENGETAIAFAERVKATRPELYDALKRVTDLYCHVQFADPSVSAAGDTKMRRTAKERRQVIRSIRAVRLYWP